MNAISGTYSPASLTSALDRGASTIASGAQQLNTDSQQIANPDAPNPTNALLDLTQSAQLAQAGAAVVRTSNQVLGTLLNAFA